MAAETPAASLNTTASETALSASVSRSLLHRLIDLDVALSLWIHAACLPIPRTLLKALEISGDGRFWIPIPISLLPFSSGSPILLGLLLGFTVDLLFVGLIKYLVRRPRPVYNKGMHLTVAVDCWSFPSGHSSRVFFIASFLFLCADPLRLLFRSHRWVTDNYAGEPADLFLVFIFVWSAAISSSRVLLGRHFVLDVVAGACLGVFEALFTFYCLNLWWNAQLYSFVEQHRM